MLVHSKPKSRQIVQNTPGAAYGNNPGQIPEVPLIGNVAIYGECVAQAMEYLRRHVLITHTEIADGMLCVAFTLKTPKRLGIIREE